MATVDWFAAEAVAAPAPARARRPRPAAVPRARARARKKSRRVTGGIVWISAFALLLAGVVAVNVAVLRANVAVNKLDQQQMQLQAENAALSSQVSSANASIRIERTARAFGLVPASASDTSYIDLSKK
jgi:cell division protein FtsL